MIRLLTACLLLVISISSQASTQIGSVAIYSDGSVEKLIEKTIDGSLWQDQRKRMYKRSKYPYLPELSYQKFPDPSQGFSHSIIFGHPERLKPYGDRDVVDFELMKKTSSNSGKKYWQCSYEGKGKFKLGKKRIETEDYSCVRWVFYKEIVPKTKETIRLKYSPKLGLIVDRRHRDSRGEKKRKKLVQVFSPEKATAKRIARTVYTIRNEK